MRMRMLGVWLLLAPIAWAQAEIEVPPGLRPFWEAYEPAKNADDEEGMDRAVSGHRLLAEQTLDLLLDDISVEEKEGLAHEIRTLAWTMDRVEGQERYIERVRFVLGLERNQQRQRAMGWRQHAEAREAYDAALVERSEEGWDEAERLYEQTLAVYQELGDDEQAMLVLWSLADIQMRRAKPWEAGRYFQRVVEVGSGLPFEDEHVAKAQKEIAALVERGIDPAGEKPGDIPDDLLAPPDDGGDDTGGYGLSAYARGSADIELEPEFVLPKKGIGGVALPNFHPADNEVLWPVGWLEGDGPADFDFNRAARYKPLERAWSIRREGAQYTIDSGDGEVTFTPSTTPSLQEVPLGDGRVQPLYVAVPGERESQFGLTINLSPQPNGARVRFGLAGYLEVEALGDTWWIYDANLTGSYGDAWHMEDDAVTHYEDSNHVFFVEPDAVKLGKKAKKALPWSSVLPVEDGFYRATMEKDGSKLTLREMNLVTGSVKVDFDGKVMPTHLVVQETGKLEEAYFDVLPAKKGGSVTLPVGTYRLVMGRIESGSKTSMDQIRIYAGDSAPFEVKEGETTVLELGAPYRMTVKTKYVGEDTVVEGRSIRVFGRRGEEYACFFDEPPQPEVAVRNSAGKTIEKGEKTRRPSIEQWQADNVGNVLYFPLDLTFPNPKADAFEVKLSQKSHRMLGGPLESDWTP